jgi:hypothetical protein
MFTTVIWSLLLILVVLGKCNISCEEKKDLNVRTETFVKMLKIMNEIFKPS